MLRALARVATQADHLAPSQSIDDLPYGGYLFSVCVGSRLDFKPWVHQWSSAAMGISRAEFREGIVAEMREMACNSGLGSGVAIRYSVGVNDC
jgi:hypothetical protein